MRVRYSLPLLVLLAHLGCGGAPDDAPDRRIVEGEVSFNTTPIDHGLIRFVPLPDGPVATAIIKSGRYRVDNKGGVPVGQVRVEITATPDTSGANEDSFQSQSPGSVLTIPDQFNKSSMLVEVVSKGRKPLVLDFNLNN